MKKFLFSKANVYILVFLFSFFIVACLKEQSSTAPKLSDLDLIEFAKTQKKSSIKIIPVNPNARLSHGNCSPETDPAMDCEVTNVEMIIQVPAVDFLPACNDVTVNFRVTKCVDASGSIFIDYDELEYKTCQSVMAQLQQNQYLPPVPGQSLEERYTYMVSIIAEFLYSTKEVQALGSGKIVETNYYADLCYAVRIVAVNGVDYAFEKTICGSACCRRNRTYSSNVPNFPPTSSVPGFQIVGECDGDSASQILSNGFLGKCDRTCGPAE